MAGRKDSDLTKMNPLTKQIFDISLNKITSYFLDMFTTKGATVADICEKLKMLLHKIRYHGKSV